MLPLDFVCIPVVGEIIEYHFLYLCLCAREVGRAFGERAMCGYVRVTIEFLQPDCIMGATRIQQRARLYCLTQAASKAENR